MNEREQACAVARLWLNKADQWGVPDPDADECVLARSYVRALEKIERLTGIVNRFAAVEDNEAKAEKTDVWPSAPRIARCE